MISIASRCHGVVKQLESYGCRINSNSRLGAMQRVLCNDDGTPKEYISPGKEFHKVGTEAIRDIILLDFSLHHLKPILEHTSNPHTLLQPLLKDHIIPKADDQKSFGRNLQAELYVCAVCQKSGLQPHFAEPDILCTCNNLEYGIAVKRIKSEGTFEDNVRKAADQIKCSEVEAGIIVLDTTLLTNPDNTLYGPVEYFEADRWHYQEVRKLIGKYHDRIQEWVRAKGVLCIIFHNHQIILHPRDSWYLKSLTMDMSTARENQRRRRQYQNFMNQYSKGIESRYQNR